LCRNRRGLSWISRRYCVVHPGPTPRENQQANQECKTYCSISHRDPTFHGIASISLRASVRILTHLPCNLRHPRRAVSSSCQRNIATSASGTFCVFSFFHVGSERNAVTRLTKRTSIVSIGKVD
jgi:hypothetical protein